MARNELYIDTVGGDGRVHLFKRFSIGIKGAVTGIAPVQAIPTTAAQWAIINNGTGDTGAASGSPLANTGVADTMFIEEIGVTLTAGTPGVGGSLWGCIFSAPLNGANATNMGTANLQGGGAAATGVVIASAVTISTPAAPFWFMIEFAQNNITPAAFSTGYNNPIAQRFVGGRISLPPGTALGLAVVAPAGTTPLYAPFGEFTMQQAVAP